MAPYQTPNNQGFTAEFIQLLNRHTPYSFELELVTRKHLDKFLADGEQGAVLFANPSWFGKGAENKYHWTPMILTDRNEVISSRLKKIQYDGLGSLSGLMFGGVLGRKYHDLEEAFVAGDVSRYDVADEKEVLKLILGGRVDVTSIPRSMALQLVKTVPNGQQLFFSDKPLFNFSRHIMLTNELGDVHGELARFIATLAHNSEWQNLLKKYHLSKNTQMLPGPQWHGEHPPMIEYLN